MAAVIYTCSLCGHFWAYGPTEVCEKCGCMNVHQDWVEGNDFEHPELEGFYERENDDDLE